MALRASQDCKLNRCHFLGGVLARESVKQIFIEARPKTLMRHGRCDRKDTEDLLSQPVGFQKSDENFKIEHGDPWPPQCQSELTC